MPARLMLVSVDAMGRPDARGQVDLVVRDVVGNLVMNCRVGLEFGSCLGAVWLDAFFAATSSGSCAAYYS